ncbi:MAG: methylenetetrahydrofolate dehydrogenase/methenyltetrahydrofolate cyclohydrolase [Actinomycetota bacterium]
MSEPENTVERTSGGAVFMDGNRLRDEMVATLAQTIKAAGSPPVCLATVLVGDDGPSQRYVRNKHIQAAKAGMVSRNEVLGADVGQAAVTETVQRLAEDPSVHGILVQSPLPVGYDEEAILALIPADKDVDGLTSESMGRLVRGLPGLVGCTPLGVMRLLERYGVATTSARKARRPKAQ